MNCENATALMSQGMDRSLDAKERIGLRAHTFICVNCRNYRLQLKVLRQAAKQMAHGMVPGADNTPAEDSDKPV